MNPSSRLGWWTNKVLVPVAIVVTGTILLAADGREHATPQEVVGKVREAALLLEERAAAGLLVLRDPRSRFMWKDTYVFVVNCDADEVMANAAFPTRQGGDIKQHTDYDGKHYGIELCNTAAKHPDGAWIEYIWPRSGGGEPTRKISFVVSVKGRPYQVGAGIYDDNIMLEELGELMGAK